jgi:adenylate cyclase
MSRLSASSIVRQRKQGITILWVVVSFFVAHLCFALLPQVFEPWDAKTLDQLFALRDRSSRLRPSYDNTVVHVDINNTSIQRLNNFYLNRSHYAQLVRNLAAMKVSVQAYDFIFAARSNDNDDSALIDATKEAGNVYFGMALALDDPHAAGSRQREDGASGTLDHETLWNVVMDGDPSAFYEGSRPLFTISDLAEASRGLGFLSIRADRDGVFRRAPLLVRGEGGFYPSLPFRVVCDYLGVTPQNIHVKPGASITLKNARCPGKPPHDVMIPIDRFGNMVVNFVGPWERMTHYNFVDVYRASEDPRKMERWKEELAERIVFISDVSTASTDIGPVPMDVNFPMSALHTNVIHTILSESFLRELGAGESTLVELLLLAIVLLLCLRFSSVGFASGIVLLGLGYGAMVAASFLFGHVVMPLVRPILFLGLAAFLVTAYRYFDEEKEKAVLQKSFEAYFPPSVVKKIVAHPELVRSRGEKKELTILFSDIKDFTALSAQLAPDQIQKYLNEYFEAMVDIVFGYEGTVDKYIGDGLMVFFGDPETQPDHAVRCVRAAVDMQKKVCELRAKWEADGGLPLNIRIGINTGEVVVGNMGSARRLSYTVLGSAVNLAQRLESNAPVGGILIAQRTYDLVRECVGTRPLGQIKVKGIETPVNVYEVPVEMTQPC